ncbi:MAG: Mrp/NBP35 family ATP-binding protein [Clostridiales bacterium]|nr:Mrp/NBP35 family ATP-binding protein [Clostridiales bacterium]
MSENCTHDCSSCSQNCSSRKKESFLKEPHKDSSIKKVIGVVSGKGGVGKSLTTALLASIAQKQGKSVGIMDADITGPSIPKMFGVSERATGDENGINTVLSPSGMQMMSMNLLLDDETSPVIWRGMVISGTVMQFWTDVIWKDLDLLFIDMPPGTGDVPLTVFQSIPIAGIVIVTTPQDLVKMVVEKAVNMARIMNIPVLGLVENMSYLTCPDCGKKIEVFGASKAKAIAAEYGIPSIAQMPLDARISTLADNGRIEDYETEALGDILTQIENAQAKSVE